MAGNAPRLDGAAAAYTCRMTAGFRAVERLRCAPPILDDPLAPALAGDQALAQAQADYEALVAAQGAGKHLRVPARNRILDDDLLQALQGLAAAGCGDPQVVNLGAGMDTRPWRLPMPPGSRCWDVDQPDIMQLKLRLLEAAGAQVAATGSADGGSGSVAAASPPAFPLRCASWAGVGADLAQVSLRDALQRSGFRPGAPTIWTAEALLYYIPLPQALELLRAMAELSGPGSRLLATCIDRPLLDASLAMTDHYFAQLWHFCIDDLVAPQGAEGQQGAEEQQGAGAGAGPGRAQAGGGAGAPCALARSGWAQQGRAETTRALALQRYGADTYVALYGGAELVFHAALAGGG